MAKRTGDRFDRATRLLPTLGAHPGRHSDDGNRDDLGRRRLTGWRGNRRHGRPACQLLLERLPLHQLHHDERLAGVLVDVVDRADVGMIERRGGLSFALEPFEGGAVVGQFRLVFHLKRCSAGFSYGMVLLSRSAADANRADDLAILFQRNAAGKDHDLAAVGCMNPEELLARLRVR